MYVLRVEKTQAESAKDAIVKAGLLDRSKRIVQTEDAVEFPLTKELTPDEMTQLFGLETSDDITVISIAEDRTRSRPGDPIDNIRNDLDSAGMPADELEIIPSKWELLGDVLILKVPQKLEPWKETMAGAYANELGAKTVLEEFDKVQGELRLPQMRLIYGTDTETIHKENGIYYELDPARVMFSSGNVDERIRMAGLGLLDEEIIVDMFSGIGYFTIPLAVYSKPRMVYACEKNEVSFGYLKKNISRNGVGCRVTPLLGDNRNMAPLGIADRILMGYIGTTHEFLPNAMLILKAEGGVVHYHETCPNELLDKRPIDRLESACRDAGRKMTGYNLKRIKSYAPGITHVVVDAKIV